MNGDFNQAGLTALDSQERNEATDSHLSNTRPVHQRHNFQTEKGTLRIKTSPQPQTITEEEVQGSAYTFRRRTSTNQRPANSQYREPNTRPLEIDDELNLQQLPYARSINTAPNRSLGVSQEQTCALSI